MPFGSPKYSSKNPVVYPKSIIRPAESPGNQIAASGTSSVTSFCGPWMIESQRMDITYARNVQRWFNGSTSASLSGMSFGENWNNINTKLDAVFTAEYTKVKSYECFDSSGYSQPQKFEMTTASADSQGMTYGTDAEFTASCLGPAGSINTSQQHYFRRKWDPLLDTETNETCEGFNAVTFSGDALNNSLMTFDVQNWFGVLDRSPHPFARGTAHAPFNYGPQAIGTWWSINPNYTLNGGYSYTQESMAQIINFINQGGAKVRSEDFYASPATIGENANGDQTWILRDQGCPNYDPGRHSFIS